MKTIYIPKGETVSYENLTTDRIVVKGCLRVLDGIKAKSISGNGRSTPAASPRITSAWTIWRLLL